MKKLKIPLIATLTAIAGISALAANSIGVNFVGDGSRGVVNTSTNSLAPTDTAGAPDFAQANWNNLGQRGDTVADGVTLTNSAGAATPLVIEWDAPGTFVNGNLASQGTPDAKLMGSGINRGWDNTWPDVGPVGTNVYNSIAGDKPLVYLNGLNAWMAAEGAEGYNIIVYVSSAGANWDTQTHWIQSVSGDPLAGTMVGGPDLSVHKSIANGYTFSGTFQEIKGTGDSMDWSQDWGANYAAFRGFTNDAVLIRSADTSDEWGTVPLDGFQIVPQFPQQPVVTDPTFNPSSTVYAGVPVTLSEAATPDPIHTNLWYRWQTDSGIGGAAFTDLLNATNSTYAFTPTNSPASYYLQFQVIVTNIFGAVTSSVVTLTVNPAVAPFVTVDTTVLGASSAPALTTIYTFAGGSVSFTNAYDGSRPIATKWQVDKGSGYGDIANSTNQLSHPAYVGAWVTMTNVQLSDSGSYQGYASNTYGHTNSTPISVVVEADPAAPTSSQRNAYMVYTNNPWAYWRLIETNEPTVATGTNYSAFDYSGHGFDAYYGTAVTVNNAGPDSTTFPGLPNQLAAGLASPNGYLTVPSLNLSNNTVTFMAWINPSSVQANNTGLLFNRGGPDNASGFGFYTNDFLGYNWNNDSATYNWSSGLEPVVGQWNFVAYVITPTNASVYLGVATPGVSTNFYQAVNPVAHAASTFSGGTVLLGGDSSGSTRTFSGMIAEAALFTNSMDYGEVQSYFRSAIGVAALPPTLGPSAVSPSPAQTYGVYSGQTVVMSATVSGTSPLTLQWQASPDGIVWTNVPGANTTTNIVNPFTVGTLNYHLKATNPGGSVTNAPVQVIFNALPASPAGAWTVNFQVTNNVMNYAGGTNGLGYYSGHGILGQGTYWNVIPVLGAGNKVSASDLKDDGATHTGIYCYLNGIGGVFAYGATPNPNSRDIMNLLNQWANPGLSNTVNGIQFKGVPDGIYNLMIVGADSEWNDRGITITVHDPVNGDENASTENGLGNGGSPRDVLVPLSQGVNFVLFNNVHVSGGTLSCDIAANGSIASHPGNTEVEFNAAQLQLVSLSAPPAVFLTNSVSGSQLSLSWSQGILQTATNLFGPWTPVYAPSPVTVPVASTNSAQFYRVKVQ